MAATAPVSSAGQQFVAQVNAMNEVLRSLQERQTEFVLKLVKLAASQRIGGGSEAAQTSALDIVV